MKPLQSLYPDLTSLLKLIDCENILEESSRGKYYAININGKSTLLSAYPGIPDFGYHVDRFRFDSKLLDEAIRSGAKFFNNNVREIIKNENGRIVGVNADDDREYYAKYVFDASGMARFAGKRLKFKEIYFTPEFIVSTGIVRPTGQKKNKEEFEFYPSNKGWYWVIYSDNDTLTWTSLSLKDDFSLIVPEFLSNYESLGKISAQNMTWRKYDQLAYPGIMILGDAACVIDPASGQGVHTAILSAIKAVKTLGIILSSTSNEVIELKKYEDWFSNYFIAKCNELKGYYDLLGIELFDAN